MDKDLYSILELSKDCDSKDIVKSYRKLALKYHPDKKNGDIETFKRISSAYEILSDENKRKQYDNLNIVEKGKFYDIFKSYLDKKINSKTSEIIEEFYGDEQDFQKQFNSFNFVNIINKLYDTFEKNTFNSFENLNIQVEIDVSLKERYLGIDKDVIIKNTTVTIPLYDEYINVLIDSDEVTIKLNTIDTQKYIISNNDLIINYLIPLKSYLYGGKIAIKHLDNDIIVKHFDSLINKSNQLIIHDKGLIKYDSIIRGDLIVNLFIYGVVDDDKHYFNGEINKQYNNEMKLTVEKIFN
jgi:curved DNA-binding protein